MLASAADERTLIEDWIVRRQRLSASDVMPGQHRAMQLQVLGYLIRRYGDSAEAARPARFSSAAEFYINDRAIVVHQHLGRGKIAGVKSRIEATRRVSDILRHLRSVHDNEDDAVPAQNDFASWVDELDQRPDVPSSAWYSMSKALTSGGNAHWAIEAALEKSPYLPRAALAYLCRCLSDPKRFDMRAAELLTQCRTETAPHYAARAWHKRVDAGRDDDVTRTLRAFLTHQDRAFLTHQDIVPDGVREQLADANPEARLAAIDLIKEAGTLGDVALLSDLVSLPRDEDEDPRERKALLDAMWAIAHRE
jgi:hypothetical protein